MNREELEKYIREQYGAEPDHPWRDSPEYAVFRHAGNRKWFALIMEVPKNKLGLPGKGLLSVVNLKCGPLLTGSLRGKAGYFPAYHMNKANWITAALDESAADDEIKMLLDVSFAATAPKRRKRN